MTRPVIAALSVVVGALMCAMMTLTFADVVGRYLFASPIPGGAEIIEFVMGTMTFAALPIVCHRNSHITVSLFEHLFRGAVRRVQQVAVALFSTATVAFMSFRLFSAAEDMRADGQLGDFLDIEVAPFVYTMSALAALAALLLIVLTWRTVTGAGRLESAAAHDIGD